MDSGGGLDQGRSFSLGVKRVESHDYCDVTGQETGVMPLDYCDVTVCETGVMSLDYYDVTVCERGVMPLD